MRLVSIPPSVRNRSPSSCGSDVRWLIRRSISHLRGGCPSAGGRADRDPRRADREPRLVDHEGAGDRRGARGGPRGLGCHRGRHYAIRQRGRAAALARARRRFRRGRGGSPPRRRRPHDARARAGPTRPQLLRPHRLVAALGAHVLRGPGARGAAARSRHGAGARRHGTDSAGTALGPRPGPRHPLQGRLGPERAARRRLRGDPGRDRRRAG